MNKKNDEATANKKDADTHKKTTKKPKDLTKLFLAISFLLSFAIIAGGIFIIDNGLARIEQQNILLTTQQLELKQLSSKQNLINQDLQKQLNANTRSQTNELITLKETIAAFLKKNQHTRRDWIVAESEYLIKLANHRLILSGDIATSIQALIAADDRLREIGNPKYIPLRKALKLNIQQLNAVTKIDIVGISSAINALQTRVATLPLHTPAPKTIEQNNNEPLAIKQIDDWKQFPSAIWSDILKLVRIQHHNESVKPLLSPEQRFFLTQNLKLQLEQAHSALLNKHPSIYKERLLQAQSWVNEYFNIQHPLTKAFNSELDKLIATNITSTLPDISESLSKIYLLQVKSKATKKTKAKTKSRKKKLKAKKSTQSKTEKPKRLKPNLSKPVTPIQTEQPTKQSETAPSAATN